MPVASKVRRLFMLAAIASIGVVLAKKLGLMGRGDDSMEYASDTGVADDAGVDGDSAADLADGGDEHAPE